MLLGLKFYLMPEPLEHKFSRKKLTFIFVVVTAIIVLAGFSSVLLFSENKESIDQIVEKVSSKLPVKSGSDDTLVRVGGSKNCEGKGPVKLTHLPMDKEDFGVVLPYGLMVGAHVTPIDHMYFSPADRNSQRDQYEVYAMADGVLSNITTRGFNVDTGEKRPVEYRMVFTHTCTFLTYYDLVTSLEQNILDQAPDLEKQMHAQTEIPVKSGQLIGRIGAQTLDFAVWDLEKTLPGFANLESYSQADAWKPYTADPYKYVTEEIKQIMTERNLRVVEPIAGKIDYDIPGKMVGNWFREGTNGYAGLEQKQYWRDHLALAYNYIDPAAIMVSVGDWKGNEAQFGVVGNSPDPATIGVSATPTKFELVQLNLTDSTGKPWDGVSVIKNLKATSLNQVRGTILLQLVEDGKLRMETFPDKKGSEVAGFTDSAKIFVR
jgi:hypothetical protein